MKTLPALAMAAALLAGCFDSDRVAGTSHETETGNSIAGILKSEDDISDSGIAVYLRSAGYARPESAAIGQAGQWADSTVTDAKGAFRLRLSAKHKGPAFLEALRDASLGIRIAIEPNGTKPIDLGGRFLGFTGTLRGEIAVPPGKSGTLLIQLLGTARYQILDSGSVAFSFPRLPAGAYVGRVTGLRPASEPVEFRATVPAGDSVMVPALSLETTAGSARGRVVMPPGTRGIAEVEAVGTGIKALTDSLGLYWLAGIPPGRHTVRATGRRPARDTVTSQVDIKSGEVSKVPDLRLVRYSILIVEGINNHDWARLTKGFKSILETAGRFRVDVSTTPPFGSDSAKWTGWNPDFTAYDAVLMDFSDVKDVYGASWPTAVREALKAYVAGGGGLVVTQSSQSAFSGWGDYRDMLGLAWGKADQYPGAYLDSGLALRSLPIGQDSSGTVQGSFLIQRADSIHPITRGLPRAWRHAEDGLDIGLRGPARGMTVLDFIAHPATGRLEPVDWTVAYGKGRVYNTSLGDVQEGGEDTAIRCAGFQTMLARGAEWAATGGVTLPLPKDFPADSAASIRPAFP